MIAKRPTDFVTNLLAKFNEIDAAGLACATSRAPTWHRRIGHTNSRVLDARQKVRGAGVQFTGSVESCETCLLNKSK